MRTSSGGCDRHGHSTQRTSTVTADRYADRYFPQQHLPCIASIADNRSNPALSNIEQSADQQESSLLYILYYPNPADRDRDRGGVLFQSMGYNLSATAAVTIYSLTIQIIHTDKDRTHYSTVGTQDFSVNVQTRR